MIFSMFALDGVMAAETPTMGEFGEFFTTELISGTEEYGEYILRFNPQGKQMTGNISMIRLRFGDNIHTSGGKKFGVEYFEFLGSPKTVEPIARIELGTPDRTSNCTANVNDGVVIAEATGNDPQLMYSNIAEKLTCQRLSQ